MTSAPSNATDSIIASCAHHTALAAYNTSLAAYHLSQAEYYTSLAAYHTAQAAYNSSFVAHHHTAPAANFRTTKKKLKLHRFSWCTKKPKQPVDHQRDMPSS